MTTADFINRETNETLTETEVEYVPSKGDLVWLRPDHPIPSHWKKAPHGMAMFRVTAVFHIPQESAALVYLDPSLKRS